MMMMMMMMMMIEAVSVGQVPKSNGIALFEGLLAGSKRPARPRLPACAPLHAN
jgi:hypothetical protein